MCLALHLLSPPDLLRPLLAKLLGALSIRLRGVSLGLEPLKQFGVWLLRNGSGLGIRW